MKDTTPILTEKILFWTIFLINVDNLTNIYLDQINVLLDSYSHLKRINKSRLKFKFQPWLKKSSCQKQITYKFYY